MTEQAKSFWASLPGVLTGVAAIITALTGLYIAIGGNQDADEKAEKDETTVVTEKLVADNHSAEKKVSAATDEQLKQVEEKAEEKYGKWSKTSSDSLVDCKIFPTVNSTASLMSWSNSYHKKIIQKDELIYSCNKAIDYRGMAHCKEPNNLDIRQALNETLTLCEAAGIKWMDIQHSSIGKVSTGY
ncbi:MAG: hypothetical protein KUG72_04040 [Pseudomonadales bacterium]|nr:hypothetical protein [Pseudomonadales bacterium]